MILVDIYVPALDLSYDFRLEESIRISVILEEICEMIQQKEQLPVREESQNIVLFDALHMRPLPGNMTLEECGITSGYRLILA